MKKLAIMEVTLGALIFIMISVIAYVIAMEINVVKLLLLSFAIADVLAFVIDTIKEKN